MYVLDEYIEQLKEKLNWYIYESSYNEYNSQEVNYIIQILRENDPEYENQISDTCITFPITILYNNKIRIEINKHKKIAYHKVIVAVLLSASIFSIIFWRFDDNAIAGLKKGYFHTINQSETGIALLYSPTETIRKYVTYEELPANVRSIVWEPQIKFREFELVYIEVSYDDNGNEIIVQYFEDIINNDFLSITYNMSDSVNTYNETVINSAILNDIAIDYYVLREIENYKEYMLTFTYSDIVYRIEYTDAEHINDILYDLIDYLQNSD